MLENKSKGQASMVDIIMLGLLISVLLVSSIFFSTAQNRAQTSREDSSYAQSMLNALMNYNISVYGTSTTYQNSAWLSFSQALNLYFCNGGTPLANSLNETAGDFLNRTIKPGYDYIFIAQKSGKRAIYQWNKQYDVCMDYITLSVFDLKLSCGSFDRGSGEWPPTLGIWPDWKDVPPASDPKCSTPATT